MKFSAATTTLRDLLRLQPGVWVALSQNCANKKYRGGYAVITGRISDALSRFGDIPAEDDPELDRLFVATTIGKIIIDNKNNYTHNTNTSLNVELLINTTDGTWLLYYDCGISLHPDTLINKELIEDPAEIDMLNMLYSFAEKCEF